MSFAAGGGSIGGHSNEAKIKLLEKRLHGGQGLSKALDFEGQFGSQVTILRDHLLALSEIC